MLKRKLIPKEDIDENFKISIKELEFRSPIGVGAGFDFECTLTQGLYDAGFSFSEIGSLSSESFDEDFKNLSEVKDKNSLIWHTPDQRAGNLWVVKNLIQ